MSEIKDGTLSKQRAEYISHSVGKRGNGDYIELKYKKLDDGAEMTTGAFITQLDEESRELIKGKGQFVVVKTKQGKYWNLTKVENMSTFTEKAKTTNTFSTNGRTSQTNTAGIKVGAVLHDAVALAGQGATTATVKAIAEELLALSYELENNVNAGKYTAKKSEASTANAGVAQVLEAVDLSSINF